MRVGGDTELNFYLGTEPMVPSGPHKDYDRDFDEAHAQIRGFGCMQRFSENDPATFYQESNLAPGAIHEKFYNEQGEYPWHLYQRRSSSWRPPCGFARLPACSRIPYTWAPGSS